MISDVGVTNPVDSISKSCNMFAANRKVVLGRIIFLIVSIHAVSGIRIGGVPRVRRPNFHTTQFTLLLFYVLSKISFHFPYYLLFANLFI